MYVVRFWTTAALMAFALGKMATMGFTASKAWRPHWVPHSVAVAAVWGTCLVEATLALVSLFGLLSQIATGIAIAIFFIPVSCYGVVAIARTGSCMCGGLSTASNRIWGLLLRNAGMATCLVVTAMFGPSFNTIQQYLPLFGIISAAAPLIFCVLLTLVRALQRLLPPGATILASPQA